MEDCIRNGGPSLIDGHEPLDVANLGFELNEQLVSRSRSWELFLLHYVGISIESCGVSTRIYERDSGWAEGAIQIQGDRFDLLAQWPSVADNLNPSASPVLIELVWESYDPG